MPRQCHWCSPLQQPRLTTSPHLTQRPAAPPTLRLPSPQPPSLPPSPRQRCDLRRGRRAAERRRGACMGRSMRSSAAWAGRANGGAAAAESGAPLALTALRTPRLIERQRWKIICFHEISRSSADLRQRLRPALCLQGEGESPGPILQPCSAPCTAAAPQPGEQPRRLTLCGHVPSGVAQITGGWSSGWQVALAAAGAAARAPPPPRRQNVCSTAIRRHDQRVGWLPESLATTGRGRAPPGPAAKWSRGERAADEGRGYRNMLGR